MLDFNLIPDAVLTAAIDQLGLDESDLSYQLIAKEESPASLLNRWLNQEGIFGYTEQIISHWTALNEATLHPNPAPKA